MTPTAAQSESSTIDEAVHEYTASGYGIVRGLLSPTEIATLQKAQTRCFTNPRSG